MKKKVDKELLSIIIILSVVMIIAFNFLGGGDSLNPAYTIKNKSRNGYSVLFTAMKELKLPVTSKRLPLADVQDKELEFIANGGTFNPTDSTTLKFLKRGGKIVYFSENLNELNIEDAEVETQNNLNIYSVGNGKLYQVDALQYANTSLEKNYSEAYKLIEIVGSEAAGSINFNEYYIFDDSNKKSLWDYIPIEGRLICYEIVLCLAAFLFYKGRRFGKVVPYYEETERIENEYLYSASSIYMQGSCYDLIMESFYNSLVKEAATSKEDLLDMWQREELPQLEKLKYVMNNMSREDKVKFNNKERLKIIVTIEELRRLLKKRRDEFWKSLKKDM